VSLQRTHYKTTDVCTSRLAQQSDSGGARLPFAMGYKRS